MADPRYKAVELLTALSSQMEMRSVAPAELVVCGGSALQVLGLVDRTTRDIDVLGLMERDGAGASWLRRIEALPDDLQAAAAIVERDFGLPRNWLNAGPADLLRFPPDGLSERLVSRTYGPRLTVHFVSRFDRIHFKMYAAMDSCEERHLDDLRKLNPTEDELLDAARWCLLQDASELFPRHLKEFLRKSGYDHVAESLERISP